MPYPVLDIINSIDELWLVGIDVFRISIFYVFFTTHIDEVV